MHVYTVLGCMNRIPKLIIPLFYCMSRLCVHIRESTKVICTCEVITHMVVYTYRVIYTYRVVYMYRVVYTYRVEYMYRQCTHILHTLRADCMVTEWYTYLYNNAHMQWWLWVHEWAMWTVVVSGSQCNWFAWVHVRRVVDSSSFCPSFNTPIPLCISAHALHVRCIQYINYSVYSFSVLHIAMYVCVDWWMDGWMDGWCIIIMN